MYPQRPNHPQQSGQRQNAYPQQPNPQQTPYLPPPNPQLNVYGLQQNPFPQRLPGPPHVAQNAYPQQPNPQQTPYLPPPNPQLNVYGLQQNPFPQRLPGPPHVAYPPGQPLNQQQNPYYQQGNQQPPVQQQQTPYGQQPVYHQPIPAHTAYQGAAPPPRVISIHKHFDPTVDEIIHYMELKSHLFNDPEKAKLWDTVIKPCLDAERSRLVPRNTGVAEHVTVPGTYDLKMRISDIYSALGYIVTETDRYQYTEQDLKDPARLTQIHHKILGHFGKWVNILSSKFEQPDDAMPSTVCIMFGPPTNPSSSTQPLLMAVFPNLSGASKKEGLKLQQDNLDGITSGLAFSNKLSPREKLWVEQAFGHCSETLGWLYLIDPHAVIPPCLLYGLTVKTAIFRWMERYSVTQMKADLRSPCQNCISVIKNINEALQSASPHSSATFRYTDQTPLYTAGARVGITTAGAVEKCRKEEWNRKHYKLCPHFRFCSWPEWIGATARRATPSPGSGSVCRQSWRRCMDKEDDK
ncbi:hypothetical protein B0H16DRAFT_1849700 [Mycena metata]|uniref:Uncharacterized protein n=1 Tax=Mycena metata TaxID=1033252 RepID=A0AAD7IRI2_9AGAR|nr:hypothetical protein B0H16DRAFT_1849700 [Mycena metata]